jgi:hypothetical protein
MRRRFEELLVRIGRLESGADHQLLYPLCRRTSQERTHDNLFPETIVSFSHECFQYKDTHQQTPQSHSASCNNRNTSRNFNIPLPLITSMYSINPISITSRLLKIEISDVFRSESTNGNRLAASCTPLNCEFTFSDPPVCCECRCVE